MAPYDFELQGPPTNRRAFFNDAEREELRRRLRLASNGVPIPASRSVNNEKSPLDAGFFRYWRRGSPTFRGFIL